MYARREGCHMRQRIMLPSVSMGQLPGSSRGTCIQGTSTRQGVGTSTRAAAPAITPVVSVRVHDGCHTATGDNGDDERAEVSAAEADMAYRESGLANGREFEPPPGLAPGTPNGIAAVLVEEVLAAVVASLSAPQLRAEGGEEGGAEGGEAAQAAAALAEGCAAMEGIGLEVKAATSEVQASTTPATAAAAAAGGTRSAGAASAKQQRGPLTWLPFRVGRREASAPRKHARKHGVVEAASVTASAPPSLKAAYSSKI